MKISNSRLRKPLYFLIFIMTSMNIFQLHQSVEVKDNEKVIIIGAGASGIAAGYYLNNKGIKNVILEARDRIGGRVNTDTKTFGYPIDLGAILITHNENNPIPKLAKLYKTKLVSFNFGNTINFVNFIKVNKIKSFNYSLSLLQNDWLDYMIDNLEELKYKSFYEVIDLYIKQKNLKQIDILKINYLACFLQCNLSGDIGHLTNFIKSYALGFSGETSMTPDGYISILKPLTKNLDIKLKTKVIKIEQIKNEMKSKVIVYDSNNNRYEASKVIITVPLGVLKSNMISFVPELSETKKESISKLKMFDMNKIFVEFSEKFWSNNDIINILYKKESDPRQVYDFIVNYHKITHKNILLFMIAGDKIDYLNERTDEQIKEEILYLLSKNYKKNDIVITNFIRTNWKEEEFTKGSFTEIGADSYLREVFLEKEGDIYFAGEHTSANFNAFVHGAFNSGLRAAKDILNELGFHEEKNVIDLRRKEDNNLQDTLNSNNDDRFKTW